MKFADLKGTIKYLSVLFSVTLLLLIGCEYLFRAALLIKKSFKEEGESRNTEKVFQDLITAFDGKYSKDTINEMAPLVQGRLQYDSWIGLSNADHQNKYSEAKNGRRRTVQSSLKCTNPKEVWFFGSSTTYGIGVPWFSTIPSKFVGYSDKAGECFKVFNFGVPYHYSFQEVIYLTTELAKKNIKKPDLAIFIDGLNDFLFEGPSIRKELVFAKSLRGIIDDSPDPLNDLNQLVMATSLGDMYKFPFDFNSRLIKYLKYKISFNKNSMFNFKSKEITSTYSGVDISRFSDEQLNDVPFEIKAKYVADNMKTTREFLAKICKMYSIKCYQFLQPVPMIDYAPSLNETLTDSRFTKFPVKQLIMEGYKKVRDDFKKESYQYLSTYDISSIFLNYKDGIPYVDATHYSPRASSLISENIFKIIKKDISK